MLLTTAYFPPVDYFCYLNNFPIIYLEACENYQKQSYRNRCRILTAGGVEELRVPVAHENGSFSLPIKQIKVDYSTPWVRKTEKTIETAYRKSPFFEYYRDELFAILDSHPETLWELNGRITRFFCTKIGIFPLLRETEEFGTEVPVDIHPKREPRLSIPAYWQVFSKEGRFTSHLSIMDLLFNEGPESICYLQYKLLTLQPLEIGGR